MQCNKTLSGREDEEERRDVRYVPDCLVVSAVNVCNVANISLPVFNFAVVVALKRWREHRERRNIAIEGECRH
jgi:hypothetical protein